MKNSFRLKVQVNHFNRKMMIRKMMMMMRWLKVSVSPIFEFRQTRIKKARHQSLSASFELVVSVLFLPQNDTCPHEQQR